MGEPDVLERVTVREVTGVFGSRAAAAPAVDELLLAGFDRADIDAVADGERLRKRIGDTPVPATMLADIPDVPRREFVAPEDTTIVFALCAAITGCLGTMIGAFSAIGSGVTTTGTVTAALAGGAVGFGAGALIAQVLGRRWRQSPMTPEGTDGLVLWVRVRTGERERAALRILKDRGAEAVHVHETEIDKHLEDQPLSSLLRRP
jgi:hypothetical protein